MKLKHERHEANDGIGPLCVNVLVLVLKYIRMGTESIPCVTLSKMCSYYFMMDHILQMHFVPEII